MSKKKNHGFTRDGVEITDELIEKWVAEAERGYEPHQLKPRRVGRPSMGAEAAIVFQVRLEPELYWPLRRCAEKANVTPSEMARRLLRRQLGVT